MKPVKKWLLLNAAFSILCGIDALLLNTHIQQWFGFENDYVLPVLGVGLLLFAADLVYVAYRDADNKKRVNIISMMDAGWVLGSMVLLVFQPFGLSTIAYVCIAAVAAVVGLFGYQQFKANKA